MGTRKQEDTLNKILEELSDVKKSQEEIKLTLEAHSGLYNDLFTKTKELEVNQNTINQELIKLKDINLSYEKKFQEMDQRSRINNIEISNFPESTNENAREVVIAIGKVIGITLKEDDIQAGHRVPKYNQNPAVPKNIIIQFTSRWKKNIMIKAYKEYLKINNQKLEVKAINKTLDNKIVYINEHLTPHYKGILKKSKLAAKDKNWKFVWVHDCRIQARKDQNDQVLIISHEEDIEKIK